MEDNRLCCRLTVARQGLPTSAICHGKMWAMAIETGQLFRSLDLIPLFCTMRLSFVQRRSGNGFVILTEQIMIRALFIVPSPCTNDFGIHNRPTPEPRFREGNRGCPIRGFYLTKSGDLEVPVCTCPVCYCYSDYINVAPAATMTDYIPCYLLLLSRNMNDRTHT